MYKMDKIQINVCIKLVSLLLSDDKCMSALANRMFNIFALILELKHSSSK